MRPALGMRVAAFVDNPSMANPVAFGKITAKLDTNIFAVMMENVTVSSPVIEVGSRVVIRADDKTSAGGLVAKIHSSGSFSVLRDDDVFLQHVLRSQLSVVDNGAPACTEVYARVVKWIRDAGVARKADSQSAATILFRRGWRADKLYLLESNDVHCLHHLNKSVRMGILEAADAERDKARYERESRKEQLKEEDWRYYVFKYSSVFGAITASFGAISVFTWNYKNWLKGQRPAQIHLAVQLWTTTRRAVSHRHRDEDRLRNTLVSLDLRHPRIIVFAGGDGAGTTLLQSAASVSSTPCVCVELRVQERLDPIKALVKALGAANLDVCGDLYSFVEDVAAEVKSVSGRVPLVLFKISDSALGHVYDDAIALACDRRVCHVMIEVSSEEAKRNLLRLPRTEVFQINELSMDEARSYIAHRVDPVIVEDYVEVIGTNIADLDELIVASRNDGFSPDDFIATKVQRCVAQIKSQPKEVMEVLKEVSARPYDVGLVTPSSAIEEAVQRDFLLYHAEKDAWVFRTRALHEASRIIA